MDSVEIVPVRFCDFVFPFDIAKTWQFEGDHGKFLKDGCTSHWHIDCDMPRQEDIRRELLDTRET